MDKAACPICDAPMPGPPAEYPAYPFCSPRCRTIDLGRWLGESYRAVDKDDRSRSSDDDDSTR